MILQKFWQTPLGQHTENFIRMYITVFLAMYLRQVVQNVNEGQDFILLNWIVIVPAAKWSFIVILNNIYQLIALPIKRAVGFFVKKLKKNESKDK